jgi:hypothetical protein
MMTENEMQLFVSFVVKIMQHAKNIGGGSAPPSATVHEIKAMYACCVSIYIYVYTLPWARQYFFA